MSAIRRAGILMSAPCGGNGLCKKCAVMICAGAKDGAHTAEASEVLACETRIFGDIAIFAHNNVIFDWRDVLSSRAKIVSGGIWRDLPHDPYVFQEIASVPLPEHGSVRSDEERLKEATGAKAVAFEALADLANAVRRGDGRVLITRSGDSITRVDPAGGDTDIGDAYGIAFDIGTTTVVGYMGDLRSGGVVAVRSRLNPQRAYGADVISRVDYAIANSDGVKSLRDALIESLSLLIDELVADVPRASRENVIAAFFAGNAIMTHILLGLSPAYLALAPFTPTTNSLVETSAAQFGLKLAKNARVIVLPGVSAYIGSDAISSALACEMTDADDLRLLVDIGTNGEILVGGKDRLIACSTAAGPAFEGANIKCGVGAVEGAVCGVKFENSEFRVEVIGGAVCAACVGICGSGLVDIVALLLDMGAIESSGRLLSREEAQRLTPSLPADLLKRLVDDDGQRAFAIMRKGELLSARDVVITQKDIRELQNAKAAIAAAIKIVCEVGCVKFSQIARAYLAGGFGSGVNPKSAARIGLLPRSLIGRITAVGNAAGSGVTMAMLNKDSLNKLSGANLTVENIDLSSHAGFLDAYVENMSFDNRD